MDTFRAAGSDRKLSELGLDLPDFLDPVIDPAELYSTSTVSLSSLSSFDFGHGGRQRVQVQYQNYAYQDGTGTGSSSNQHQCPSSQQHSNGQHHHHHQPQQHSRSGTKDSSNVYFIVDTRAPGSSARYVRNSATRCSDADVVDDDDDDPLAAELRLVDVVNDDDADDDEVVLGNGWLDEILDEDNDNCGQSEDHVTCVASDDVIELQHVSDEHSYSLSNDTADNELDSFDVKIESDYIDIDGGLFEMINPADLTLLNGTEMTSTITMGGGNEEYDVMALRTRAGSESDEMMVSSVIKSEPLDAASTDSCYSMSPDHSHVSSYDVTDTVDLPLTPPGSNSCSSESEAGGLSPRRSPPITPSSPRHVITAQRLQQHHLHHHHASNSGSGLAQHNVWTASLSTAHHQPFPTNPIPASGILILSEEEKRTLVAEGYPVPSKLPLTKQEEKNLKKIRRKIKNKISAQESRRKKKEYLETLEKKVEVVSIENISLRKKIDLLENNNRSLAAQLQKLQSLASKLTTQMQAASCIAVN